jgi:ribosome modulation factor
VERNTERTPISDLKTLSEQDERDMIYGYRAGLNGREEPSVEFNRAYWHGWRNGMADSGRMQTDWHMQQLAKEYLGRNKSK